MNLDFISRCRRHPRENAKLIRRRNVNTIAKTKKMAKRRKAIQKMKCESRQTPEEILDTAPHVTTVAFLIAINLVR